MFQATSLEARQELLFSHLSIEDGLSQAAVTAIEQDAIGFLWLGTQNGLNRYDGDRFVVFRHHPEDPATLPDSHVLALATDADGDLWIGTRGGLSRLHLGTETFDHFQDDAAAPDLSGCEVRSLAIDSDGSIWIGTTGAGLKHFDPHSGQWQHFRHDPDDPTSLGSDSVRSLLVDRHDRLWIGTLEGLDLLVPSSGSFLHYRHDASDASSLTNNGIRALVEDGTNRLWVATFAGLNLFDPETGKSKRFDHDPDDPKSLSAALVRALLIDNAGRLWAGTDGGLDLRAPGMAGFERYQRRLQDLTSLAGNRVISLFQDRSGLLWVGTQNGLSRWNPRTLEFHHIRSNPQDGEGLSGPDVFALAEDADGKLWVGTTGGLDRVDLADAKFEHFRHAPEDPMSLGDDTVTALLVDSSQTLWVGTHSGGLQRFDAQRESFISFRRDPERSDSLSNNGVASLFEDSTRVLWIGTAGGGLNRLSPESEQFIHYGHDPDQPSSLSSDWVTAFAEDTDGKLWIGTFDGLNHFDPVSGQAWRIERPKGTSSGLLDDTILALHLDDGNDLWIGTEYGLHRLRHAEDPPVLAIEAWTEHHGLPDNVIYGILPDDQGSLWLSTNRGLAVFDPETGTVMRTYDSTSGLQSNEFHMGASYRGPDGRLYFGGTNGFNAFDPSRVEQNETAPSVVLTGILKMNQRIDFESPLSRLRHLELDHRDDLVTFEVAALDFTEPSRNRYRYRLVGLHPAWIDLQSSRRVSLNDLAPGRHMLRIQGANSDGAWSEPGVTLTLRVTPPFWQTWWFRGVCLLALTSMIGLGHHVRTQSIRKRNAELAGQVERRTRALEGAQQKLLRQERLAVLGELAGSVAHEIRNPLSVIKGSIFYFRLSEDEMDEDMREQVDLMEGQIERTNQIITELLDYTRDRPAEVSRFAVQVAAENALAQVDIPEHVALKRELPMLPLLVEADPDQVERLLENLIRNAIEAMPEGGDLLVSCESSNGSILTRVRDSGVGIPPENLEQIYEPLFTDKANGIGLGLAIAKRYAGLNAAQLNCQSTPGQGTTFLLSLPIDRATQQGGTP